MNLDLGKGRTKAIPFRKLGFMNKTHSIKYAWFIFKTIPLKCSGKLTFLCSEISIKRL